MSRRADLYSISAELIAVHLTPQNWIKNHEMSVDVEPKLNDHDGMTVWAAELKTPATYAASGPLTSRQIKLLNFVSFVII